MLDYETLDFVADLYVPVLTVLSLNIAASAGIMRRWILLGLYAAVLLLGALIAYGLMYIDISFQIWPSVGLDYSTHTAVALVLVVFLVLSLKRYWLVWLATLVCYILLMLYQGYHGVADIATTSVVVGVFLSPVVILFHRLRAAANQRFQPTGYAGE